MRHWQTDAGFLAQSIFQSNGVELEFLESATQLDFIEPVARFFHRYRGER